MAPMSLLFPAFLLSFLLLSDAQTIIGSSPSFPALDLPNYSPAPTKQAVRFWPSLPSRGRSDVPVRVTVRDKLTTTNMVEQEEWSDHPMTQLNPFPIFTISTQSPSRARATIQPTASRSRTDTASLAFGRDLSKREDAKKGLTLSTLPSVAESADDKKATGNPAEGPDKETEDGDSQGLGSGRTPTEVLVQQESPHLTPTVGDEMAQYRPQAQTMISKVSGGINPPVELQTVLTTTSAISSTQPEKNAPLPSVITQQTLKTLEFTGWKYCNEHISKKFKYTCHILSLM